MIGKLLDTMRRLEQPPRRHGIVKTKKCRLLLGRLYYCYDCGEHTHFPGIHKHMKHKDSR